MEENKLNQEAEALQVADPDMPVTVRDYVQPDMLIGDIIKDFPISVRALMECGMGCVTCPASQMETLEEAAMVHYLDPEEVRSYLNERISYTKAMEESGLSS